MEFVSILICTLVSSLWTKEKSHSNTKLTPSDRNLHFFCSPWLPKWKQPLWTSRSYRMALRKVWVCQCSKNFQHHQSYDRVHLAARYRSSRTFLLSHERASAEQSSRNWYSKCNGLLRPSLHYDEGDHRNGNWSRTLHDASLWLRWRRSLSLVELSSRLRQSRLRFPSLLGFQPFEWRAIQQQVERQSPKALSILREY